MQNADILAIEQRYEVGLYTKRPLAIVRGEGAYLFDAEGRRYIDCVGGQGSANLGHAHPTIVHAIRTQVEQLLSCPEILPNDQRALYLQELAAAMPFPARFYLCNSGTEAVEAGIKFARLITGRTKMIAAVRGFHGRTMGALSATWEPKYREPFEPLLTDFMHVPYDNLEALESVIDDETAAVLLEPIQGEGGVRVPSATYLPAVRSLCDRHGALLIADEIQTGFGRTGKLFAIEHQGVTPDMLLLAKSIAGGLPMGTVALHERHGTLPAGSHGSTFGGNPLACAAARAALATLRQDDLPTQACMKGEQLMAHLRELKIPLVREVRGMGLLIGIELRQRAQPYIAALIEQGILALPAGPNVIRLLPPLVISAADLAIVAEGIQTVCRAGTKE